MTSAVLADVCEISMGQAPGGESYNDLGLGLPLIAGAGDFADGKIRVRKYTTAPTRVSKPGDIVLGIRATIGVKVWADDVYCLGRGVAGLRAKPSLDQRFLWHWLSRARSALERRGRGATFLQVNRSDIGELEIALPPLEEQRRIATVLDLADDLRFKRRATLALTDVLKGAAFARIFSERADRWPEAPFVDLLEMPLRNGVSPSANGTVSSSVLTLSAVTGSAFDPTARRTAMFAVMPRADKRVSTRDLLICRGNGNRSLVGRGFFPRVDLNDVAFPDTVIAARVAVDRVDRAFLEYLWGSSQVRRQIESLARTTNGTFKINQTMLESITLPMPPLSMQRRFGQAIQRLGVLYGGLSVSADVLDVAYASLQERAFAGQL